MRTKSVVSTLSVAAVLVTAFGVAAHAQGPIPGATGAAPATAVAGSTPSVPPSTPQPAQESVAADTESGKATTGTPAGAANGTEGSASGETTANGDAAAQAEPATPVDMRLIPAQPEFTVVNLPTTLRLPPHRFAFRVTHRFTRDLTEGGFDDLLADFFGFDGGAQIGLELRYGIMRGWQASIYRTSDRTIQFATQYNVFKQGEKMPFTVDALATIEGSNNFNKDDKLQPTGEGLRTPALGTVVSRVFGKVGSINATLAWLNNTNNLPSELVDDNNTVILGIGGHVRIRPTVYLVGEVTPRISGYKPDTTLMSFAIEKRVGGHAFQINFSNGFGTTLAQVARGGIKDHWYIGFNINRKFF